MTLLDRFRTPSRQSHPDPVVRLAYVAELPLADREAIAAMASEDEDPRVRRAAVAKLMDPRTLASIAEADRDEGVRSQAAGMLRDIALEAFEDIGEAESLEAVDAMTDPRALASVAKSATREIVALRAMSRVDDPRLLGSIARHAVVESARRGAVESLRPRGERAEILSIAMNGDFKDTALSALELVTDRGEVEQIAARGRNKSAAKRARAILREAEEQAALDAAEVAAAPSAIASASAETAPLRLTPHGEPNVETVVEPEVAPDAPGPEAEQGRGAAERARAEALAEAEAKERADRDRQARLDAERGRARLAELLEEATAARTDEDLSSARRRFNLVRQEWRDQMARAGTDPDLQARFSEAEAQMAGREAEAHETEARTRRDAFALLHSLLGRVEPLAAQADVSLKGADRALRDVRTALSGMPPLPTRQDVEAVTNRLKAAQTALTLKVQELREADDWRRFSNVAIQEQLCAKMEALQAVEDAEAIAREVHKLQGQWREAADVPRAQADALWRRFKAAHDAVWPRCEAHFAALAGARAENLAKKTRLCEHADLLADSTNWIQTAEEIKKLQAEWKTIGAVSHGREKVIWDRFRAACDQFFTRRHEDLAKRKATWAENLGKKEALSVRAEALAESTDWDQTAVELKRLQADWKTIGPVKKSKSDAIWLRFRGACDRFFSRYAQRHDTARAERVAAREAICAELEGLAGEDASEPASGLLETIRAIRVRWHQEIAARGVDPQQARALDERYSAAYGKVVSRWTSVLAGSDLDPEANRKRMEALVRRIEDLAVSIGGPASSPADQSLSPTTRLATMLKEALAANTIGGKLHEDSRLSAAAEEVRQAQAAWSRIGAVPDEARRQLSDRFQRACRRISERVPAPGPVSKPAGRSERSGQPRR